MMITLPFHAKSGTCKFEASTGTGIKLCSEFVSQSRQRIIESTTQPPTACSYSMYGHLHCTQFPKTCKAHYTKTTYSCFITLIQEPHHTTILTFQHAIKNFSLSNFMMEKAYKIDGA